MFRIKSFLIITLWIFVNFTKSSKILAVPFPWKSHYQQMERILLELVSRGHEVVVVIPDSESYGRSITLNKIVFDTGDLHTDTLQTNAERRLNTDETHKLVWLREFTCTQAYIVNKMLQSPHVISAAKRSDFLFTDASYIPVVALADHFDLPFMVLSPWGFFTGFYSDLYGIRDTPATYPVTALSAFLEIPSTSTKMSLLEQVVNYYAHMACHVVRYAMVSICLSSLESSYMTKGIISKWKDVQLVLVPFDFSVEYPLSLPPLVKVIGPLTVGKSQSLPYMYEDILSKANDGVVITCFGGTSTIKDSVTRSLLHSLLSLKQIVIWKFRREAILKAFDCVDLRGPSVESQFNRTDRFCNSDLQIQIKDKMEPFSADKDVLHGRRGYARFGRNVYVFDWIPQNDLLGHDKVTAFISHCGTNGMYESFYHKVPMICIPLFGDHWENAGRVISRNLGVSIHYSQINPSALQKTVATVTSSATIRENLNMTSKRLRATKQGAVEYGADLIELHMRYGDSSFLRPQENGFFSGSFADFLFYGPHFILIFLIFVKLYTLSRRYLARVDA